MKKNKVLFGFLSVITALFICVGLTGCGNESAIEESAIPVMNTIIQSEGGTAKCTDVEIIKERDENIYEAKAILDNDTKVDIVIEVKGDQILVFLAQ